MNNYIDERVIPYRRPQVTSGRTIISAKSQASRKNYRKNMSIAILRRLAAVFLLILSTFSGEKQADKANNTKKVLKGCMIYSGIALAVWFGLVVLGNLVNAISLLPLWSLILIFALTMLGAFGVRRN